MIISISQTMTERVSKQNIEYILSIFFNTNQVIHAHVDENKIVATVLVGNDLIQCETVNLDFLLTYDSHHCIDLFPPKFADIWEITRRL